MYIGNQYQRIAVSYQEFLHNDFMNNNENEKENKMLSNANEQAVLKSKIKL